MALIGILSTLDSPLLPGYPASLSNSCLKDFSVICDSKRLSSNQKKLSSNFLGGWSIAQHFDFDVHHASRQPSIIRQAMPDESLRHVKNSFGMAS